jgi:hypothetical protein
MADRPDYEDIVEQGEERGRRFRAPGWLPSWRPALSAAAGAALIVGLAAGYTAGDWHARHAATPPTPAVSTSSSLASTSPSQASVTFQVNVRCPGAYPVRFTVGYHKESGGQGTASLPGFADLSEVPYSGCPASSAAAASS